MTQNQSTGTIIRVDDCEVDLKNPYIAAFLALLIPGAGHFYQGRRNKAYLYCVCVLSLFVVGMVIGNGRVVYASFTPDDMRIQFIVQPFVGLPAAPALAQAWVAKSDPQRRFLGGFMAAPPLDGSGSNRFALSDWHREGSASFELGTLYTAVAGLLNILVIFDAFAGPMPLPQSDERRKKSSKPSDGTAPQSPPPSDHKS